MARTFVRGSSYLSAGATPVTGPPCTLAGWFRCTDANNAQHPFALANGTTEGWSINFAGDIAGDPIRAFSLVDPNIGVSVSATGGSYSTGVWYHVAAVFARHNHRLCYVNGTPGTADEWLAIIFTDMTDIFVGAQHAGGGGFNGSCAEVALYSNVLSDSEIADLASGGTGGIGKSPALVRPDLLAGYWKLLAGDNNIDYSGNGYHMTAIGTPTDATHPPIDYGSSSGSPLLALMQQYSLSGGLL